MLDRTWLIDSRGFAKKVINASLPAEHQIKDCGATRQCPNCLYLIDNSDVSEEWPGLPAGVKFDPSDVELLDHLAEKRGDDYLEPHPFIDKFIPTLEGDEGICYTHPENLPGAKKDGSSVHFFHRIINAYASGQRKRRRIQDQESMMNGHVRWHKTGKTKPVMENGVQKGFKKIMVLYATSKKGSKPEKCNWVMHQYHLGTDEDEKEGDFIVSKIFYQPQKETDKNDTSLVVEESDIRTVKIIPRTRMTNTPDPPRSEKTPSSDCLSDDCFVQSLIMETEYPKELSHASCGSRLEDEVEYVTCLAENCEAVDLSRGNTLVCGEIINSSSANDDLRPNIPSLAQVGCDISAVHQGDNDACCGIGELDKLELDTLPDFQLDELTFASQDSFFDFFESVSGGENLPVFDD